MKNTLLPKYALIIIFVISSSNMIYCNLCDLQKSQTIYLTNMNESGPRLAGAKPLCSNVGDSWGSEVRWINYEKLALIAVGAKPLKLRATPHEVA